MGCVGLCSIMGQAERPEFCHTFPEPHQWRPTTCTYSFDVDGVRQGACDSSACGDANCCNIAREGGTPMGKVIPSGSACSHLRGMESVPARPQGTMVSMSAMWSGNDVYVVREPDQWGVGVVLEGAEVGRLAYIPKQAFDAHLRVAREDLMEAGPTTHTVDLHFVVAADFTLTLRLGMQDIDALESLIPRATPFRG